MTYLKCFFDCRECGTDDAVHIWKGMMLSGSGHKIYEFRCTECLNTLTFRPDKGDVMNIEWIDDNDIFARNQMKLTEEERKEGKIYRSAKI